MEETYGRSFAGFIKIKNLALILVALVFAVGILAVSVWRTSSAQAPSLEATEAAQESVDYFLAYPGILPDHLLYPIKMIRDRIWLFLTTDPLKKAELFLLFADKRLGAGKALIEKDKIDLGVKTITKAEKYLERAVQQERKAREKGKETTVFLERLSRATLKHEEILLGVKEKVTDLAQKVIEQTLDYPRHGQEEVRKRLGK